METTEGKFVSRPDWACFVPATVGLLAAAVPFGTAMGACALCAYALAFCAAVVLPETSGTDLHTASPVPAGQTETPLARGQMTQLAAGEHHTWRTT